MGLPENVHRTQFPVFMICLGPVGRLGMALFSPIPYFLLIFWDINDPLSEITCHLGPNVNSWDALGASREPTFPLA